MGILTELLFELHVAATPDKLNKVSLTHSNTYFSQTSVVKTISEVASQAWFRGVFSGELTLLNHDERYDRNTTHSF